MKIANALWRGSWMAFVMWASILFPHDRLWSFTFLAFGAASLSDGLRWIFKAGS